MNNLKYGLGENTPSNIKNFEQVPRLLQLENAYIFMMALEIRTPHNLNKHSSSTPFNWNQTI